MSTRNRRRGFTLIELLVALLLLAILLGIAAPNVGTWIRAARVRTAASDLYTTLIFARSEAIKRSASTDIVPVDATAWRKGWQVSVAGTVLKVQDPYPDSVAIAGPAATVSYRRDGRLDGAAAATFTISAPTDSAVKTKNVSVELSGRPNVD